MKKRVLSCLLTLVLLLTLLPGAALAAGPTGLVARQVNEAGQLEGPLMTELRLQSEPGAWFTTSVVFFYVDPDTGVQTMLYPDQVSISDPNLNAFRSSAEPAWLPVVSIGGEYAASGLCTLFLSGTENGASYTYTIPCRVPAPTQGLFHRQERTMEAYIPNRGGCQYLNLPEHAIWYLAEGGLTAARADALTVEINDQPYSFTKVQNASGTYDVKIELPYSVIKTISYPTLVIRDGSWEQHLVINTDGAGNLPHVVIRHVSGSYGSFKPASYLTDNKLSQKVGDQVSYLFYWADEEANLELLRPTAIHSAQVRGEPLGDESLPAWTLTYVQPGAGDVILVGRHPDGSSYAHQVIARVSDDADARIYLTRNGTDLLPDQQISYDALTDGTLWVQADGGVPDNRLAEAQLTVDSMLTEIPAPGEDAPSDLAHWVLRDDGGYDLKLTVPRPQRHGCVSYGVSFFGGHSGGRVTVCDRTFHDGTEGVLFQPHSYKKTLPGREIIAAGDDRYVSGGSFLYCDDQGIVRVLKPTSVTVADPAICSVSRIGETEYAFMPHEDGDTTATITGDGYTYTMPLHAHLAKVDLYTRRVRHGDNLLPSDSPDYPAPYHIHSEADVDALWILKDGGFSLAEAQGWTCYDNQAGLTPVPIAGTDRYDLRVDVTAPTDGYSYLNFTSPDFLDHLGMTVKPYAPVELLRLGANVYVNLREPVDGHLLLMLFAPNGQLLRLDLQELRSDMENKPVRLPWHVIAEYRIVATALGTFFQPLGQPAEIYEVAGQG